MAGESGTGLSWWRRAVTRLGMKSVAWANGESLSLTDPRLYEFYGSGTSTGRRVDDSAALKVSTAWACVRLLAEAIGAMPRHVMRYDERRNTQRLYDHPLAELLAAPNRAMTGVEFFEAMAMNLVLRGNGYAFRDNQPVSGAPIAMLPLAPSDVTPFRDSSGAVKFRVIDRGKSEDYPPEKIWHWKGFGPDGLMGLSPLRFAAEAMGMALTAEEFGARMFAQGATVSAIVSYPGFLKPDQREVARENLRQMYLGLVNAHKPLLLEGDMKVQPGIFPPEELQFLQLRLFQVRDICRFYRVQPHMVADLERATYASLEQSSLDFVTYTLLPYITRIEASASRWLLPPKDRGQVFLKFNFNGLLRADSTARATLYSILLQNGVLTRNEVRELEDRNRSDEEGMDDFTVQKNMSMIDRLDADAEPSSPAPGREREEPKSASTDRMLKALIELRAAHAPPPPPAPTITVNAPPVKVDVHNAPPPLHSGGATHVHFPDVDVVSRGDLERLGSAVGEKSGELMEQLERVAGQVVDLEQKLDSLASAAEIAAARAEQEALRAQIEKLHRQIEEAAHKMAIFDEKGEPIGVRPMTAEERAALLH